MSEFLTPPQVDLTPMQPNQEVISDFPNTNLDVRPMRIPKQKRYDRGFFVRRAKSLFRGRMSNEEIPSETAVPTQESLWSHQEIQTQHPNISLEKPAEAESLLGEIHDGKDFPVKDLIEIMGDVAKGLQYAHNNNVIHGNVKPSKILFKKKNGTVSAQISDFSHSRDRRELPQKQFMATRAYVAPERLEWSAIEPESDQYSLAVTATTVITGKLPIGQTPGQLLKEHMKNTTDLERKRELEAVAPVLRKALSLEPGRRYRTVREFSDCLAEAYREASLVKHEPEARVEPPKVGRIVFSTESHSLRPAHARSENTGPGRQIERSPKKRQLVATSAVAASVLLLGSAGVVAYEQTMSGDNFSTIKIAEGSELAMNNPSAPKIAEHKPAKSDQSRGERQTARRHIFRRTRHTVTRVNRIRPYEILGSPSSTPKVRTSLSAERKPINPPSPSPRPSVESLSPTPSQTSIPESPPPSAPSVEPSQLPLSPTTNG